MKIRISKWDKYHPDMWSNKYVGCEFDVVEIKECSIPKQYVVSISNLVKAGLVAESSRGLASVPFSCVEIVPSI